MEQGEGNGEPRSSLARGWAASGSASRANACAPETSRSSESLTGTRAACEGLRQLIGSMPGRLSRGSPGALAGDASAMEPRVA